MLKALALCGLSALAGAALPLGSADVAVYDYCGLMRYTRCAVAGSVTLPTTSDPRHRAEMTRLVRQVSRDKL